MEFGSGRSYITAMDRDYEHTVPKERATNDVGVPIKDIGFSLGLGPVPNVQALAARMRTGHKKMELTFMGMGKGSAQAHSPEMYGEKQRQAIKELQKVNRYDFTTHSSVGITGLAGMDQRGNFSKQSKENSLNEIKRAVHFASDVMQGGPVVVHSGEFFRNMADADWNTDPKDKFKEKFKLYEGEEETAAHYVVDRRSGEALKAVRINEKISRPEYRRAKEFYFDENGIKRTVKPGEKIDVDYEDRKVPSHMRVPDLDEDGVPKLKQIDWRELQKEADIKTEEARNAFKKFRKYSLDELKKNQEFQDSIWKNRIKDVIDNGGNENDPLLKITREEAYILTQLETQAASHIGWGTQYAENYRKQREQIDVVKDELKEAEKKLNDPNEIQKEIAKVERQNNIPPGSLPPEQVEQLKQQIKKQLKKTLEQGENTLDHLRRTLPQYSQGSSSSYAQAKLIEEQMSNIESSKSYALRESYDSYANAAINAMLESERLKKKGELKRPLAITVENLSPELYGGHPDELIDLIVKSRERMVQILKNQNMSEKEAIKKAEDHLYATFDTAHCNMWFKYWQGDEKKTMEENKKDFDAWMLSKVEEMAKKKIVGHLHLVDNFGYNDEHLAPGEGNTRVKEALEIFKKHGYKGDIVVEPGADFYVDSSGMQTLFKAWKHFGNPIYGSGMGRGNWEQVTYNNLGMNQPPYFTFGSYSPSEDWTLWSGVPLE